MITLEFDEKDKLDVVLASFGKACSKLALDEIEQSMGEDLIRRFHTDLVESSRLGNQARLEKIFGKESKAVRVVAVSSQQRGYLSKFFSRLRW